MAINTQSLLSRLNPLSAIDVSGLGGGETSMQRKQLKLMREKFEEEKRQNAENTRLDEMKVAAAETRERMISEREAEKARAEALAKTVEQRRAAYGDVYKYEDAGDVEGMENAANRLNESGGYAERLGEDANGMPTWRVNTDGDKYRAEQAALAAQAAPGELEPQLYESMDADGPAMDESLQSSLSRMGALGYGKLNTRGNLNETRPEAAAPLSTEDAFRRAQGAAQGPEEPELLPTEPPADASEQELAELDAAQNFAADGLRMGETTISPRSTFERTGKPARGPDNADLMGGVPNDVIDTGAMAEQTKQRLGPVMAAIERSMPAAYQQSTADINEAALGAGLSGPEALKLSLANRGPANAAIASELAAERDLSKEERAHGYKLTEEEAKAAAEEKDPIKRASRMKSGNERAETAYKLDKIPLRITIQETAEDVVALLSDNDQFNDEKAINLMMDLNKQVGAQSDADALRMTGESKVSYWERVKSWFDTSVKGGFTEPMRVSMKDYARRLGDRQRDAVNDYIERMETSAGKQKDPLAGTGYRTFVEDNLSGALEAYRKENPSEEGAEAEAAEPGDDDDEGEEMDDGEEPTSPAGTLADDADFHETLDAAAEEHGVDADKIRRFIGPESGGDAHAKNQKGSSARGLLQFIDSTARQYGFKDADEFGALSAAEQAPYMAKYFADRRITKDSPPEDYALAIAAPGYVGKSRNDGLVIKEYRSGTEEGDLVREQNPAWIPKDGGEITVGSIIDYYMGHGAKTAKKAEAPKKTAAAPKASGDAKLLEGI